MGTPRGVKIQLDILMAQLALCILAGHWCACSMPAVKGTVP